VNPGPGREKESLLELAAGERGVGSGAGEMREGAGEFQTRVVEDIREKLLKFSRLGAESIHPGVELGLDKGGGPGFFRRPGEFAGLLHGGEGDGESMGQRRRKFRGQGGAQKENRFPDTGLAEFGSFGGESDAELLTTGTGEGLGDGNQPVSVSVIFHDGKNPGPSGSGSAQGAKVGAQGRKGNGAPGTDGGGHRVILGKIPDDRKLFVYVCVYVDGNKNGRFNGRQGQDGGG
jgi:hypothetical protein